MPCGGKLLFVQPSTRLLYVSPRVRTCEHHILGSHRRTLLIKTTHTSPARDRCRAVERTPLVKLIRVGGIGPFSMELLAENNLTCWRLG